MSDIPLKLAEKLALEIPPSPDLVTPAAPASICFTGLVNGLVEKQWFVEEDYLPEALCNQLQQDLQLLHQQALLSPAGIGRGKSHLLNEDVRGDYTHWLDGSSLAQQAYLAVMRELKNTLNQELFLGLFEYESHYALYPPGAFYKKHLDSFRGRSNRKVTTLLYLNPAWKKADAGEMRLYHPQTKQPILDVAPRSGTLVCFMSEDLPHEVLPTQAERRSIAGWFRCNSSLNGRIDPAL